MKWQIENTLGDKVSVGWFALRDMRVVDRDSDLDRAIEERASVLRSSFSDPGSAALLAAPARRLYHLLGMDPSKHRPSSEALMRRILQGKGLYHVNSAVDAANLTSIHHHRPVGLYDADKVIPIVADGVARVVLRVGCSGEEYPGIRKEMIHLEGRPALVDDQGPFGNPSADSDRTKVSLESVRLLFVLFEPAGDGNRELDKHLALSVDIMRRHVGGELEDCSCAFDARSA